jgi:hypothetical protein
MMNDESEVNSLDSSFYIVTNVTPANDNKCVVR